SGKPCKVNRSFCVAGSAKYSACFCFKREYMPWPAKVFRFGIFIYQCLNGLSPVRSRNTGSTSMSQQIYRNSKWRMVGSSIFANHQVKAQLFATIFHQGCTDKPTAVSSHKVYYFGRNAFRSTNEISF